jgi:hypothetical protein
VVAAAALGLATAVAIRRRPHWVPVVSGSVFGVVVAGWFVSRMPDSFGEFAWVGILMTEGFFVVLGMIPASIVGYLLLSGSHGRTGWGLLVGAAAAQGLAYLVLATYVLLAAEDLAPRAAQAHESPAWGFLVAVAVMAATALRRRLKPADM